MATSDRLTESLDNRKSWSKGGLNKNHLIYILYGLEKGGVFDYNDGRLQRKEDQRDSYTPTDEDKAEYEKIKEDYKQVTVPELIKEIKTALGWDNIGSSASSSKSEPSVERSQRTTRPIKKIRTESADTSQIPEGHPCLQTDEKIYKNVVNDIYGIDLDRYPGLIIRNMDFKQPGEYKDKILKMTTAESRASNLCRKKALDYANESHPDSCIINDTNTFSMDGEDTLYICVYAPASQVLSQGYNRKINGGRLAHGSSCQAYQNYLTSIGTLLENKPTLIYDNTDKSNLRSLEYEVKKPCYKSILDGDSETLKRWFSGWNTQCEYIEAEEKKVNSLLEGKKIKCNIECSKTYKNIYLLGIPGIGKTHSLRDILKILYKIDKTGNSGGLTIEPRTLEALCGKPPSSEQVLFEGGSLSSSRSTRKSRRKSDTVVNKSVLHNTKKKYHSA